MNSDFFCAKCGQDVELEKPRKCRCSDLDPEFLMIKPDMLGRTINYPRNWLLLTKDKNYIAYNNIENKNILTMIEADV
jgi:hypothetical protein